MRILLGHNFWKKIKNIFIEYYFTAWNPNFFFFSKHLFANGLNAMEGTNTLTTLSSFTLLFIY